MAEDAWDNVLVQVNLRSVYVCSRAAIPAMLEAGRGAIVNVASIAASVCVGGAAYAATKGGIVSYTRHVGRELAGTGSAGQLRLARVHAHADDHRRAARARREPNRSAASQEFGRLVPMQRTWARWTTSPTRSCSSPATEAGYITGQELIVDGGYVVR